MPSSGGSSGGSSAVIARDRYLDKVVASIASGDLHQMPWGGSAGPDALLNLSDPTAPTVIESGVYAVAVNADADSALTADYAFQMWLSMDFEGDLAEQVVTSAPANAIFARPRAFVSNTYYVPAGHSILIAIANIDSVSRDYKIEHVTVQRLS